VLSILGELPNVFCLETRLVMNIKKALLLSCSVVSSTAYVSAQNVNRPNVIILQADDLGYDDLSSHGNQIIETRNLDKLATESVSFQHFYVHSVCAPSRASLLTGRHFLKTGVSGYHGGRDFMNLDEVTIAEAFKKEGYRTGMWGKWHTGKADGYYPWDRGFDEAYMAHLYRYENSYGLYNGKRVSHKKWADEVCSDYAIEFMKKNKDQPFLMYLPYLAPHGIWDAPKSYVEKYERKGLSKNFSTLSGMIEHLDFQIGRILAAVSELGLEENTIILFMSDNGPVQKLKKKMALTNEEWELRNPSQMKGSKAQNWENGIRSPLFIKWKGRFQPGINNNLVSICDIFPTMVDIADVPIPENSKRMDGMSILPTLEDSSQKLEKRSLFIARWDPALGEECKNRKFIPLSPELRENIRFENQVLGVHQGRYKLLLNQKDEPYLVLKDLETDPREQEDFSDRKPQLKKKLLKELKTWYESVLEADSYNMPTFLIGHEGKKASKILCYGPHECSNGLINTEYCLTNWRYKGDFAEYTIEVQTPGKYELVLKTKGEGGKMAKINLSVGHERVYHKTLIKKSDPLTIELFPEDKCLRIELLEAVASPMGLVSIELSRVE